MTIDSTVPVQIAWRMPVRGRGGGYVDESQALFFLKKDVRILNKLSLTAIPCAKAATSLDSQKVIADICRHGLLAQCLIKLAVSLLPRWALTARSRLRLIRANAPGKSFSNGPRKSEEV
ncbi:hypothetical protein [Burkholderia multivorans]|uniref:hypothetical protein n=1 Tax=Burkholderia multivorans TaxID=87883 RepID=UPI0012DAE8CA|nr:hypothetical protein [Burkholderia multivorans]